MMKMIPWVGISCCLSAAVLYILGRSSGRDAELLKSVTPVNQLTELAQLLDLKILPLVVTISGKVGSETPVIYECSGLRGVAALERDDGSDRVNVVGARRATGFVLPAWIEVFEKSDRSLECTRSDYLKGLKMLGVKRTVQVLPVGTSLTVGGEVAKDGIGNIRIQRPRYGPFYVARETLDQLIANLGGLARVLAAAAKKSGQDNEDVGIYAAVLLALCT